MKIKCNPEPETSLGTGYWFIDQPVNSPDYVHHSRMAEAIIATIEADITLVHKALLDCGSDW